MKKSSRTPKDNQIAQLENEVTRLNKKITKYEALELKQNRYGLVWLDVPEAFENDVENKLPILDEVPELAIKSNDGKPTHLLIEGDNYHALTCLNYTHKGKVDVIYIDPPYNTGSDGFKYKDKRFLKEYPDGTPVPVDHPLRHSYWLSFMRKRLELAKDILKDDGVIFISIDDSEFAQLKLLSDEIFNEKNLIGIFTWIRKKKGSNLSKEFRKITEYVLAYRGGNKQVVLFGQAAYAKKEVPLLNRANNVSIIHFPANKIKVGKGFNNILVKKGAFGSGELQVELLDDIKIKDGYILNDFRLKGRFRWAQKTIDEELENGSIFTASNTFRINIARYNQADKFKSPSSLLSPDDGIGTNEDATEELRALFPYLDKLIFDYPKPVSLIKYLISSIVKNKKEAKIIDFFAGSGTTGQAVMELNDEDKGGRQFILITDNNEVTNGQRHKIMTDICYPRIKKVINGYNSKKGLGNSVRYFKTAFVGKNNILKADDADKIELAHNAGGMLAIAENTFDQFEKTDFWQIFENEKQFTAIYFREEFTKFDDFVERVEKLKKPVVVYIFSWEKELEFTDFDDNKNIKVKTIPQPILEIYKEIYNLI